MLPKLFIVLVLLVILGSLASGLVFLIKDKGDSDRTVKALTWRISLSVALFLLLMLGYATGVLQPHGVYPTPPDRGTAQAVPPAAADYNQ